MNKVYDLLNEMNSIIDEYKIFENYDKKLLICYLIIVYCFLMLYFYLKNNKVEPVRYELDDQTVLNYIERKSYDCDNNFKNFFSILEKIVTPYKGDIVSLRYGKWKNYFGLITKYNELDDTYNIKIFKNLNPDQSEYPKHKIVRNRDEFIVDRYLN